MNMVIKGLLSDVDQQRRRISDETRRIEDLEMQIAFSEKNIKMHSVLLEELLLAIEKLGKDDTP